MHPTSFQRRIYALLTSLTCAGLVACNSHDSSDSGKSPDSIYGKEPAHSEVVEENVEMGSGKGNSGNVILEGTLGPGPARRPLDKSLVSGSTVPEGSDTFVREEAQVLFGSGASESNEVEVLSPEKAASPQNSVTENGK